MLEKTPGPWNGTDGPLPQTIDDAVRRISQLEAAVESHGRIGQAMGILMATHEMSAESACSVLSRVAQRHSVTLRALADAVISTICPPPTELSRDLANALEELRVRPRVASRPRDAGQLGALGEDRYELLRASERVRELILAADDRDVAAEARDRAAEARDVAAELRAQDREPDQRLDARDRANSDIDRFWAGSDRDAAAADRAELRELAGQDRPPRRRDADR